MIETLLQRCGGKLDKCYSNGPLNQPGRANHLRQRPRTILTGKSSIEQTELPVKLQDYFSVVWNNKGSINQSIPNAARDPVTLVDKNLTNENFHLIRNPPSTRVVRIFEDI